MNLYCVLNKGELGFFKDAKSTGSPYNNEAALSLSNCQCDVTNGYKKKKNVFTLKTKDGSEFLFHAKDEDDLKAWVGSITASISEHQEIGKWGQPQPTTSSTDEGTRREGSKAERASERASDRAAERGSDRGSDRGPDKDKERGERSDKTAKSESKRSDKSSKKK